MIFRVSKNYLMIFFNQLFASRATLFYPMKIKSFSLLLEKLYFYTIYDSCSDLSNFSFDMAGIHVAVFLFECFEINERSIHF